MSHRLGGDEASQAKRRASGQRSVAAACLVGLSWAGVIGLGVLWTLPFLLYIAGPVVVGLGVWLLRSLRAPGPVQRTSRARGADWLFAGLAYTACAVCLVAAWSYTRGLVVPTSQAKSFDPYGHLVPAAGVLLLIGLLLAGSRPPIRARRTAVRVILVTSWIALVGGYVFPIHLREATTSRKADCLSNVKKLALALLRYGDDHHGRLPEASSWYDELLGTYVKDADIFRCAEAPDLTLAYSLNPALSGVDLRDIEDRESLILVFECDSPRHVEGSPGLLPAEPRHYGGDNYGFADGHAVWGGRARLAEQGRGEVIWGSRPADDRWRWEPSPRREEDG